MQHRYPRRPKPLHERGEGHSKIETTSYSQEYISRKHRKQIPVPQVHSERGGMAMTRLAAGLLTLSCALAFSPWPGHLPLPCRLRVGAAARLRHRLPSVSSSMLKADARHCHPGLRQPVALRAGAARECIVLSAQPSHPRCGKIQRSSRGADSRST